LQLTDKILLRFELSLKIAFSIPEYDCIVFFGNRFQLLFLQLGYKICRIIDIT